MVAWCLLPEIKKADFASNTAWYACIFVTADGNELDVKALPAEHRPTSGCRLQRKA
jgi:hypothetical protein